MRCLSCNAKLTEFESTRRGLNTNEFIDLCNQCYSSIREEVLTIDREDLEDETDRVYSDVDFDKCVDYTVDSDD